MLETSIKPYPAVATATAPIRAAIELHRAGLPAPEEIERLVVRLPAFALNTPSAHPERRYPAQIESAQHSFYFCTAVALLEGACGEAQFAPAKLAAPELRELLAKVELQEDAEFTSLWPQSAGGAVELFLRDGSRRSHRCPYPPGHPRLALTDQELAAKYHDYADPVLTHAGALALRNAVYDLDACDDLREFARLMAAGGAPSAGDISPGEVHAAIDPDAKKPQRVR
jgi:2-methylcitrate dehydratase